MTPMCSSIRNFEKCVSDAFLLLGISSCKSVPHGYCWTHDGVLMDNKVQSRPASAYTSVEWSQRMLEKWSYVRQGPACKLLFLTLWSDLERGTA